MLNNKVHVYGQVGLDMVVKVPSGAGKAEIALEATTDFTVDAFSLRVCSIDIYKIGKSLPCVKGNVDQAVFELEKTVDTLEIDDKGKLTLGPTCPVDRGTFIPEGTKDFPLDDDNEFRARVVFELPPSDSITDGSEFFKLMEHVLVGLDLYHVLQLHEYQLGTLHLLFSLQLLSKSVAESISTAIQHG